ncbi:MAG: hypothetical protein LBV49_09215 [Azonexus sp.]|jgi:hypothetical protein|nr:hypothetical protein [Azonexus sp.]
MSERRADAAFACLEAPAPRGLARLQAALVDRIKRAAIRLMHRSAAGECLILRLGYIAEVSTERALQEDWTGQMPDWLIPLNERHLADEQRHAAAFAEALRQRGVTTVDAAAPDPLSRRKIAQWRRLAHRYAPRFEQGLLVPVYATGLCAEQMAMRVLARHCAVIGENHPLYPLLSRVLSDEAHHVRLCMQVLQRLVTPGESRQLAALLAKARAIDASFGVTGALAMYLAVGFHWLHSGVRRAAAVT